MIYIPKGKAREYGEYALNIYRGCSHGCKYCYAPAITHCSAENYLKALPRKGVLEAVKKEAQRYAGKNVFLCFTCDPYQPIEKEYRLTRSVLEIFFNNEVNITILSKGGLRALADIDILEKNREKVLFGTTLTFIDSRSAEWEPNAASSIERIISLQEAHSKGIKTWISIEPVIDPEQSIKCIEKTLDFVSIYKVGRWNHDLRSERIDWKAFGLRAVAILKEAKKEFIIKKDLQRFLI
jgi:DNA repair photolyase